MIKTVKFLENEEFIMNLLISTYENNVENFNNELKKLKEKGKIQLGDTISLSTSLSLAISDLEYLIEKCDKVVKKIDSTFWRFLFKENKKKVLELKKRFQEGLENLSKQMKKVEEIEEALNEKFAKAIVEKAFASV